MSRCWLMGLAALAACSGPAALTPDGAVVTPDSAVVPPDGAVVPPDGAVVPATATDFHDGTRLKFSVWRAADGTVQRKGAIFDTARGEGCTLEKASDGKLRCLPGPGGITESNLFVDSACTQPLASGASQTKATTARGLLPSEGPACDRSARWEIRELGALYALNEGLVAYTLGANGCSETRTVARLVWYRTGAIVPPETFVAVNDMDVVPVKAGGRIHERHVLAEDGAWFRAGLFDTAEQRRCDQVGTSDGQVRCVPAPRFRLAGSAKGRADCSGPTLADEAACSAVASDIVLSATRCARQYEVHAIAQPYAASQRFTENDIGVCVASPNFVGTVVPGAVIEPARYAALELLHEGSGRLRQERYAHSDGARLPTGWLYDTELKERCTFAATAAAAGEILCRPPALTGIFTDRDCTQPVGLEIGSDPCAPEAKERYVYVKGKLHARGARLAAPPAAVFEQQSEQGRCLPSILLHTGFVYYEVGAEVPIELVVGTDG